MQVVILAGGLGIRIKNILGNICKPMAPINDKPFLEYLIENLKNYGFKNFLFLVGYKKEQIINYFLNGHRFGIQIEYSIEKKPLDTGGALINAFDKLEDEFILINGDTFFDIEFDLLIKYIHEYRPLALIVLRYTQDFLRYGFVEIDTNNRVLRFIEKSKVPEIFADGYINGGIYYFKKRVLSKFLNSSDKLSLEKVILPKLIDNKEILGLPMGGKFIDIGIPEDYEKACKEIPKWIKLKRKGAYFLDRDGVLIKDTGYPHGKNIEFLKTGFEIVKKANKENKFVIIVTNQAGVAKGKFSEKEVLETHEFIKKEYNKRKLKINAFYYCPYHPDGVIKEYKKISFARKPFPGMILKACEDFRISIKDSIMIGDKDTDNVLLYGLKFKKI